WFRFTAGLKPRASAAVCLTVIALGVLTVRHMAQERGEGGQYDLLIVHGHIIDGSGSPWFEGSVAVKDGRIAGVGRLINPSAKRVIDASGLMYAPNMFATTEELIELAKVAAKYGGIYTSHIRSEEGTAGLRAIGETIRVGEGARLPVHILHFKMNAKANWGRMEEQVRFVQEARDRGVDI